MEVVRSNIVHWSTVVRGILSESRLCTADVYFFALRWPRKKRASSMKPNWTRCHDGSRQPRAFASTDFHSCLTTNSLHFRSGLTLTVLVFRTVAHHHVQNLRHLIRRQVQDPFSLLPQFRLVDAQWIRRLRRKLDRGQGSRRLRQK